ncbi:MAG: ABC transporter substrate-binding protein [Rhizobiaceae bacterium]
MLKKHAIALAAALTMSWLSSGSALAEAKEVRIAHTYALTLLPHYVVLEQKLIEKHAKALGLGDVTVTFTRVNSGQIGNDLLLSGNVDIVGSSTGPLLTAWDKTSGAQKVKGILGTALYSSDLYTVDPKINSLDDYGPNDRIAMTDVKTSTQALILQMKAAKERGWDNRYHYNPLLVSMGSVDALAALVSGKTEVKSHMTTVPFSYLEQQAGARPIFRSKDFFGRMISATLIYGREDFKTENPKLFQAVVEAYKEANDFVNKNRDEAAEIYIKHEPQKQGVEFVKQLLDQKEAFQFDIKPAAFQEFADYMQKSGLMRNTVSSWKDVFFDSAHDLDGN